MASSDLKAQRATPAPSAQQTLRPTVAVALQPSPLRDGILAMLRRALVPYELDAAAPAAVVICDDCTTSPHPGQYLLCFGLSAAPGTDRCTVLSPLASTDAVWAALCAIPAFTDLLPAQLPELSAREVEILAQVCLGNSNEEIARLCYVSTATVKTHLMRIFRKLGVHDRAGAVYVGVSRGILDAE